MVSTSCQVGVVVFLFLVFYVQHFVLVSLTLLYVRSVMHRYGQLVDGIFSIFTLVQIEIISVIRCCVVFFCFSSIKTGGGVGVTVIFCKPLFIVDSLIECVSWVILWRSCVRRCLAVVSLAVSYHHLPPSICYCQISILLWSIVDRQRPESCSCTNVRKAVQ